MKIYHSIREFTQVQNAVVTIGTFDGVHAGHQRILKRVNELASSINGQSIVLTFFPHPRMVLYPSDHGLQLLNTMEEKIYLIDQCGINHLIIHPFSKEFSRTSSTGFVRNYLVNSIGTKYLVIGYDHHFGRNRQGTLRELEELAPVYGFKVEEIPEQDINDIAVSSTKIRNALIEGNLETANLFLGYPYLLTGTVIQGKQRGKKLGFPTANLEIKENYKLIPASGIYLARVKTGEPFHGQYRALLSIGKNPTFGINMLSIEVYILDFNDNLYGRKIQVEMLHKLRDEIKFDSENQLIEQMKSDESYARNWFARLNP